MSGIEGTGAKAKVIVLISSAGTNMDALIQYSHTREDCPFTITRVVADRPCLGLAKARRKGIPAVELDRNDPDFRQKLHAEAQGQDYIVLAGYLSILEPRFIASHRGKIMNIHPSLLPRHGGSGMYGLKVHEAVLKAGDLESGCTVHLVDEGVDSGRILLQRRVPVLANDTALELRERILPLEHQSIVEGLLLLMEQHEK